MKDTPAPIGLLYASILPENECTFLNRSDLMYTVRHDKVIIYKGRDAAYHAKKRDPLCDKNLLKRKYNGILSKSAIKQISKQITLWSDSIDFYNTTFNLRGKQKKRALVFLTLTLSANQEHSDNEIKRKILIPFIDSLKYHYDIQHYFWRAEAQKNGNIHFHLILDKFIPWMTARDLWNTTQERLGYVTRFEEKNGHRKPNSTDIRIVDSGNNTINYVLKYATKQEYSRALSGRLWGMSDTLRSLRIPTFTDLDVQLINIIKAIHSKKATYHFDEHYMSISFKEPVVKALRNTNLAVQLRDYYMKIYSYLYFEDSPFDTDPAYIIYQGLDIDELQQIAKFNFYNSKDIKSENQNLQSTTIPIQQHFKFL